MSRRRKRKTEYERFMKKVRLPTEPDGCWLWLGAITSSGHGTFRVWDATKEKWKVRSAHKYSYLHHNGSMKQPWLHIRHTCDVRHCVNPAHLIEGTRSQNMQDMIERGRGKMQFEAKKDECPF